MKLDFGVDEIWVRLFSGYPPLFGRAFGMFQRETKRTTTFVWGKTDLYWLFT